MVIPLGKIGQILKGECPGWYVVVEDDTDSTGGYYILLSNIPNFKDTQLEREGYDYWVEHEDDLEPFFSDWIVQWEQEIAIF